MPNPIWTDVDAYFESSLFIDDPASEDPGVELTGAESLSFSLWHWSPVV